MSRWLNGPAELEIWTSHSVLVDADTSNKFQIYKWSSCITNIYFMISLIRIYYQDSTLTPTAVCMQTWIPLLSFYTFNDVKVLLIVFMFIPPVPCSSCSLKGKNEHPLEERMMSVNYTHCHMILSFVLAPIIKTPRVLDLRLLGYQVIKFFGVSCSIEATHLDLLVESETCSEFVIFKYFGLNAVLSLHLLSSRVVPYISKRHSVPRSV